MQTIIKYCISIHKNCKNCKKDTGYQSKSTSKLENDKKFHNNSQKLIQNCVNNKH